jgi:hypothetical protein
MHQQVQRNHDERRGQRELVHVAPGHARRIGGEAPRDQRREVHHRRERDQHERQPVEQLRALGNRRPGRRRLHGDTAV